MATIVKSFTFSAGAVVVASQHNTNFDTIYNDYNTNITNVNISPSAAISATKLSLSSIAQSIAMSAASFSPAVTTLTDGATPALDASTGNVFKLTAAGNRTIAIPTNATTGQKIVIAHTASAADRTLALNTGASGFRFGTDITALTATTSGKTDYIGCIWNSTDSKWDVVAYVKGY